MDVMDLSARELALQIRLKNISPVEAVRSALDRIDARPELNAFITIIAEQAMAAARKAGFEFPVLLVFLQIAGVLTPQTLLKGWRFAIMAIFAIAAIITPSGDPISMLALAVPMSIFYLISIVIGLIMQRRKRKRALNATDDDDDDHDTAGAAASA